MAKGFSKSLSQ